jgi:glycosyltransferase XagB
MMSDAVGLVQAILDARHASEDDALAALEEALEREVDPLDYCAATLGIGHALAMERAAKWAGLAFFDVVPRSLEGDPEPVRLEALAHIRAFHTRLFDRPAFFSAPGFFDLLRLKQRFEVNPGLRQSLCLVPEAALRDYLVRINAPALIDEARQRLTRRWPYAAAQLDLTRPVRIAFGIALVLLVTAVVIAPFAAQAVLLPIALCLLAAPAGIRIAAMLHRPRPQPPPDERDDAGLPVYSVLIPLRDEAHMVPQLVAAMRAIDYPPEKLDIKFVVEDRSPATLEAVARYLADPRFSLICVPDALPRTKPKALDFALPLCRGELVVVFDAEDTPHPDQLRQVALRFRNGPDLQCIQAELYIDNAAENRLTALFAGEYAGIFRVLLPAFADWGWPMPLGGTSNHFRTATLRAMGGWDAFNVTEDADLGVRLARLRYRCQTIALPTLEEAPIGFAAWIGQRTRWMKGWMQTFIVHNRKPAKLLADMGPWNMLAFEITVLGMIVAPFLHAAFILTLLVRLGLGMPAFPDAPLWIIILALGYGSALALPLVGLHRQKRPFLFVCQLVLPLYWLAMAAATARAVHDLIDKPFHWIKTPHRPVGKLRRGQKMPVADKLEASE